MNQPVAVNHLANFFDWAWKHKLLMLPIVLALGLSVCSGIVGLIYISALDAIHEHPLHQQALELAKNDPQLQAALGHPLTGGFFSTGQVQVDEDNLNGFANVEIPIAGPLGQGRLILESRLTDGTWIIDQMTASLESGKVISVKEKAER